MQIFACDWVLNQTGHANTTDGGSGTVRINANFFWATIGYIAAAKATGTQVHGLLSRRDPSPGDYGGGFGIRNGNTDCHIDGFSHCWNISSGGSWQVWESGTVKYSSGMSNTNMGIIVDPNGEVTYWGNGTLLYTSLVPAPNPFYWVIGGGAFWNDPLNLSVDTQQLAQFLPYMGYFEVDASGGGGGLVPLVVGQDFPPSVLG